MANSKIEDAARNWFIGIPQGDNLYHLTYEQVIKTIVDFAEQLKAQKQKQVPTDEEIEALAENEYKIDTPLNHSYRGCFIKGFKSALKIK